MCFSTAVLHETHGTAASQLICRAPARDVGKAKSYQFVRRAEVDISDIPIALRTEQYFAFLKNIYSIDIELAGEFLVMAASLVEIKSRTLAPQQPSTRKGSDARERSGDDPRFELVQQLLAYQQFRTAARTLDRLRQERARRYGPGAHGGELAADATDYEFFVDIEDAHVLDLVESFERIMQSVDISRLGDHRIEYDDTPISLHQADLVDRLACADRRRMTPTHRLRLSCCRWMTRSVMRVATRSARQVKRTAWWKRQPRLD